MANWREEVKNSIKELKEGISDSNKKLEKLSELLAHNAIGKNDVAKFNELILKKYQYQFAINELYQLLGRVQDEQTTSSNME